MEGYCIIVGAGEFNETAIERKSNDLIIAADGGLKKLENLKVSPDIVIGDFDSLGKIPDSENFVKLPVEKDVTDTAAAIEIGLKKGYKKFKIYGGTGGRADHTIANIQNIVFLAQNGISAELISDKQIFTAIYNKKIIFDKFLTGYVSVFSYSDISEGVFIKNMKYCLNNATLKNTFPLGVSNEFIGKTSEIEVKNGTLLLVYERQNR